MPLQGPPPLTSNPLKVLIDDVRRQRRATVPFPPGEFCFSLKRSRPAPLAPRPLLLDCYNRYGPVGTTKLLWGNVVWMIGPAANLSILAKNAKNFQWRESQ